MYQQKKKNKNVSLISFENYNDAIIKLYDEHSIFILPSYTEGHPQVLDEALARQRPVIIFEDIAHVIRNRKGIFVSKRNIKSLEETIEFIIGNYSNIKEELKANILPTKKNFINELKKIILEIQPMIKNKIIILCGGRGKRMGKITKNIPKPMVRIGKTTIIEHKIKYYRSQGIHDFIFCTGYKSKTLKDLFKLLMMTLAEKKEL